MLNREFSSLRVLVLALMIFTVGCSALGVGVTNRDDSAANLMPNLPNYNVTNSLDITAAVANAAGVASFASLNLPLAGLITAANNVVACYQRAGAVEGRVYVNRTDYSKVGGVLIVNQNKVLDPGTLLSCLSGGDGPGNAPAALQPCAAVYSLPKNNNTFHIAYVASDISVCNDFCNNLEGCTVHRGR